MTDEERRRQLWKQYWRENDGEPFPQELRGLTCGAKTRKGTPCKQTALFKSGRCKFHGGMSTGPKTLNGRRRSAANIGKNYDDLLADKRRRQMLSIDTEITA